jgi:hypothetical protein
MMPARAPQAQLEQARGMIASHEMALAAINRHIEMMANVQAAQRNVYLALEDHYESQGVLNVASSYSRLVVAMTQRDVFELEQLVTQREAMTQHLAHMRDQLDALENPSPIIGVDLRRMGPHN